MPFADADGARLYYEETGTGDPIVFVHEFAGDCRSWETQIRHFSRRYRCIAFNARGYPPSDVPDDQAFYSQDIAADDIAAVMRGAGIDTAHVVGMSMGGFAALHFGLRYADMARSIVIGACGYGAKPEESAQYALDSEAIAGRVREPGRGRGRGDLRQRRVPAANSSRRTRAAGPSSATSSPSTRPRDRRGPCAASRSSAPRCGTWRRGSPKCRFRR